jgi:hypothetical protein
MDVRVQAVVPFFPRLAVIRTVQDPSNLDADNHGIRFVAGNELNAQYVRKMWGCRKRPFRST